MRAPPVLLQKSAGELARDRFEIRYSAAIEDVMVRTNDQEIDRVFVELLFQPAFDVADDFATGLLGERDQPHGEAIAQAWQSVLD